MRVPLDFLPMALCGLATIVAVAAIVVVSDLLRRSVLLLIARVERSRAQSRGEAGARPVPAPPTVDPPGTPGAPPPVSRRETLPG